MQFFPSKWLIASGGVYHPISACCDIFRNRKQRTNSIILNKHVTCHNMSSCCDVQNRNSLGQVAFMVVHKRTMNILQAHD